MHLVHLDLISSQSRFPLRHVSDAYPFLECKQTNHRPKEPIFKICTSIYCIKIRNCLRHRCDLYYPTIQAAKTY